MQLRSEQFQSSLEYIDEINPSVIPYVINIMNSIREKGTSYQQIYRWILPTVFNIVGNIININDTSSYFLFFFLTPYFSTVIPMVYVEGIVMLVFTNEYSDEIFCW